MDQITTNTDSVLLPEKGKRKPLSEYFKEMVYGGVDGIVTTFAVVSGFSGATLSSDLTTQLSFGLVMLFGIANLFADGISIGLGNFLSVRSEKDQYRIIRGKEKVLLHNNPTGERKEAVEIMLAKGFSREDANTLTNIYSKNEDYWLDFMMASEHKLSDPRGENPILTGLITFGSFVVLGSVPILPFVFLGEAGAAVAFQVSAAGTFLALVLLGLLKWKMVGTSLIRSLSEIVLVGSAAAMMAFIVGTFFKL